MELQELIFKANTKELERVVSTVDDVIASVEKLNKVAASSASTQSKASDEFAQATDAVTTAQNKNTDAVEKNTKARKENASAIPETTSSQKENNTEVDKSNKLLERQKDILEFQTQGWSKAQSSILATAKAAKSTSDEMQSLMTVLDTQRKLMGPQTFDNSRDGLKSLTDQYRELSEALVQYENHNDISLKQARELSRDKERIIARMTQEGQTAEQISGAIAVYNQEYAKLAASYNQVDRAMQAAIQRKNQIRTATNAVVAEEARMAAALNQSNAALDKGATDSLVRYEANLRKMGLAQEEVTRKLSVYKGQLEQVQEQEKRKSADHLARALSPQLTDIGVSLYSGQNPLTVLLQQGGQMTDLFRASKVEAKDFGKAMREAFAGLIPAMTTVITGMGQFVGGLFVNAGKSVLSFADSITGASTVAASFGNSLTALGVNAGVVAGAMRALSGVMLASVIGVIVAAVAAFVSLGVGLYQVIKSQDDLAKNLTLTGASFGISQREAINYAQSLSGAENSTASYIAVINEMAKTGGFTAGEIATVTKAAVELEKWGGVAITDTVKRFAELKKDPVDALIKVAQETGNVSAETLKLVSDLYAMGNAAEASKVAMKAYADSTTASVAKMKEEYSGFATFFINLTNSIGKFFSDIGKGIWYKKPLQDQLNVIEAEITRLEDASKRVTETSGGAAFVSPNVGGMSTVMNKRDEQILKQLHAQRLELQGQLNADLLEAEGKKLNSINALNVGADKALEEDYKKSVGKKLALTQSLAKFQEEYLDSYLEKRAREVGADKQSIALNEKQISQLKEMAKLEWDKGQKKPKEPSTAVSGLGLTSSNEISLFEQQYNREITLANKLTNDKLAILKNQYEAGLLLRTEYQNQEIDIVANSDRQQLSTMQEALVQRKALYEQETAAIIAAYQKRVQENQGKKNTDEVNSKNFDEMIAKIENATRSLNAFEEKVRDTQTALGSASMKKYYENLKEVSQEVKKAEEVLSNYTEAVKLFRQEAENTTAKEDALRFATPEQTAIIEAEARVIAKYTAERAKLNRELEKVGNLSTDQSSIYQNTVQNYGIFSPQAEAARQAWEAAFKKYDELRRGLDQSYFDEQLDKQNAATAAALRYRKDEEKKLMDGVSDALMTALIEGGDAGKKKLRALLVAELTKPIRMFVDVVVRTLMGGLLGSMGFGGAAAAGQSGLGMLGSIGSGYSLLTGIFGSSLGGGISAGLGGLLGSLGIGATGTTLGGALSAGGIALQSGNIMGGVGTFVGALGPVVAGLALIASLLGKDKSGTYHSGGMAQYSASGGMQTSTTHGAFGLGFGGVDFNQGGMDFAKATAQGMTQVLDRVATMFGKKAGYSVAAAFADDTSKDPSWGGLLVKDATGKVVINWDDSRTSKWAPRQFADGQKGSEEYANAVAKDIRDYLVTQTPDWADKILNDLGDKVTTEGLSQALDQIAKVKDAIDTLGAASLDFANMTDDAKKIIIDAAGGPDAFAQAASSYVNAMYSDSEKYNMGLKKLQNSFQEQGLTLPKSIDEYKRLTEGIDTTTEAGAKLYAFLLQNADAFAQMTNSAASAIGMSKDGIAGILRDAISQASSAEEARKIASDQAGAALQEGLMNMVIDTVSQSIMSAIIQPLAAQMVAGAAASSATLLSGAGAAGGMLQIGGMSSAMSMASGGSASAAANAAGGMASASATATGGSAAAQAMMAGGMGAAEALVAGGAGASNQIKMDWASLKGNIKDFLGQMVSLFKDPEFQGIMVDFQTIMGDTAAELYDLKNNTFSGGGGGGAVSGDAGGGGGSSVGKDDPLKKAYDNLVKVIEKEKQLAKERLDSITKIYDISKSAVKNLRNDVESVTKQSITEARGFFNNSLLDIANGIMPDANKYKESVDTLVKGVEEGLYASQFEADRARLLLSNELQSVVDKIEPEKSVLEKQLDYLEQLLKTAKDQYEALTNPAEAAMSLVDAIKAWETVSKQTLPTGTTTTASSPLAVSGVNPLVNYSINVIRDDNTDDVQVLREIKSELMDLRAEVRAGVIHESKIVRILERVTPDGDSLQTTVV